MVTNRFKRFDRAAGARGAVVDGMRAARAMKGAKGEESETVQNVIVVRTPTIASLPIREPGSFGFGMPPPGRNAY